MLTDAMGDAALAHEALLAIRPSAVPNLRMLRLGDRLLRTGGAMERLTHAWEADRPEILAIRRWKAGHEEASHPGPAMPV